MPEVRSLEEPAGDLGSTPSGALMTVPLADLVLVEDTHFYDDRQFGV